MTLQEQLQQVREKMNGLNRNDREQMLQYNDLKAEESRLVEQIGQQEAKMEKIEEKVQAEEIRFAIEGVDMTNLPDSLILVIEKVVKADRRRIYSEHAIELDQLEEEARKNGETIEQLRSKLKECEDVGIGRGQEIDRLERELFGAIAERDEAFKLRDNAASQLEEANNEIARLKSEIDDYQKAKAFGEKEAQNIIDVTPSDADEINAAIKQFLTSEDWGSVIKATKPDGSFELVKRDEFEAEWAPIEPPTLGGSESTESFLGEDQAQDHNGDTAETEETPEDMTFQAPHFPGASDEPVDGEVVQKAYDTPYPTWEDYESLQKRVSKLEQGGVKAA